MIAPGSEIDDRADEFPHEAGGAEPQDVDPLHRLLGDLMAVREHAIDYLATEADLIHALVRRYVLLALVGALLAVVVLAGLITGVVFALSGFAGLVSDLSGIPWLGELLIGCGVIGAAVLAGWATLSGRLDASRRKTLAKYESKHKTDRVKPQACR